MGDVARNIKQARKDAGHTQEWLADKLCVSQTAIALWERGTRIPSLDMIEKIANILEVSPSYLMGWNERDSKIDLEIEKLLDQLCGKTLGPDEISTLIKKIENLISEQTKLEGKMHDINSKSVSHATLSAHFNEEEYTPEELEEIKNFAEFVKSKRKDTPEE